MRRIEFAVSPLVTTKRTKVDPSSRRSTDLQAVAKEGEEKLQVPDTFEPVPDPVTLYRPPPVVPDTAASSHAHTVCPVSKANPTTEP